MNQWLNSGIAGLVLNTAKDLPDISPKRELIFATALKGRRPRREGRKKERKKERRKEKEERKKKRKMKDKKNKRKYKDARTKKKKTTTYNM